MFETNGEGLLLRKTISRHEDLKDLASGKITHPGAGIMKVLVTAGAIKWDRPANTFRVTAAGRDLLRMWAGPAKTYAEVTVVEKHMVEIVNFQGVA